MYRQGSPEGLVRGNVANKTSTTAADVLPAPGVGWRLLIHDIMVTNSNTTTGAIVTLQDDAGSPVVLWAGFAAAGQGWAKHFERPIVVDANRKVQAILSATLTTNGVQINVLATIEKVAGPQTN